MEQRHCTLVLSGLLVVSLFSCTSAQLCSQTVFPSNYIAFPSIYNNVVVLSPSISICEAVSSGTLFRCDYAHVLGDGAMVPSTPDLSNSMYLEQFVAWERRSVTPYIDFDLTTVTTGITAIELSFLNSPSSRISLPDIELSRVTYDPSFDTDTESSIASRVLNNQDLALTDNQVRTVFVRPGFAQASLNLRISFQFNSFHDFDWLLLNEVRFCTDPQPSFRPVVMFLAPLSNVIQPSAGDLTRRSTELVCTVSSAGPYTWQWEKDNNMIGNNGEYTITIGDGSRTTKLTINNLDFSDAAEYKCTGMTMDLSNAQSTNSSIQDLQFPEFITAPDVSGYLQTGEVTLTCELHGYQSSLSPPVWLDSGGSEITTTTKYTITSDEGSKTIVFENGTTIPSVIVSLTIRDLSLDDGGTYTCRGVRGGESVTQLGIKGGTAPPTTLPPTTQPPTTSSINGGTNTLSTGTGGEKSTGDNTGVIAAAVVVVLFIVIILVAILVIVLFVYIRIRDKKTNISPTPHGNSYIEVNPKRRLTKNDIQWRLSAREIEDSDTAHIYSMIDKNREESLPPVPSQDFDETDFNHMGFENEDIEAVEYNEIDPQPGLKVPKRRPTNSTKPKLAKITKVDSQSALDHNPIYESTSIIGKAAKMNGTLDTNPTYAQPDSYRNSFTTVSSTSDAEPLYSEAIGPSHFLSSNSLKSSTEPVYSEALNPTNFKQDKSEKSDKNLLPYGPVYALPLQVTKVDEPPRITPDNIHETSELGVGQFGEVVLAETVGLSEKDLKLGSSTDKNAQILVAVKKLKDQADSSMKESFEKEIKFMSGLSDDNIVRLLAVCDKEPKFIVIEYMENGDMYQYLNQHELAPSIDEMQENQIPVSILLYMGVQIASGMRYLASLKYVHRDLASRNCLVGKNFMVKISDFGMSRSLYESVYYRVRGRAMLPIRWMAMESFFGRFSEKTDVWSFGITLWEIFTMGRFQPYEELDDQDIIQDAVRNKQRKLLPKPEACPEDVYRVMLRCWEYKLENRATFAEIFNSLSEIQQNM